MDYLIVSKGDNEMIETIDLQAGILIRYTSGLNSENYVAAKQSGLQIKFSIVLIEGTYYIGINGEHLVDYKKFVTFKNIEQDNTREHPSVRIRWGQGECIVLNMCDTELMNVMIHKIQDVMKSKIGVMYTAMYYIKKILI